MILHNIRLLYIVCIFLSASLIGMEEFKLKEMEIFETDPVEEYFDPTLGFFIPPQQSLSTSLERKISKLEYQISNMQERAQIRKDRLEKLNQQSQLSDEEKKEQKKLTHQKQRIESWISQLQKRLVTLKNRTQEKFFEEETTRE